MYVASTTWLSDTDELKLLANLGPGIMKRVLIVEDDADVRRMFRTALTLAGYEVLEAGDGLNALRMLDANPPDVVVLDLDLPLVDGHAVRQEIAAQVHTHDIPVVVVTGLAGDHDRLDVACVLKKPVTPERLISTIRSCLSSTPPAEGPLQGS